MSNKHFPDPKMLELLVCPLTKTNLRLDEHNCELYSRRAKLAYPIRDGIPVLITSEAREMADEDIKTLEKKYDL